MVVLVGSQATLGERLCCPFSVLLLPHFPCLTLREMASSGIYKLDNGKSYLNNCFPAKNLLRMPDEGQLTSQIDTFASHSAPTSIFSLSSPFITGPYTTQPHPFPSIFPQQSQGAFKSACWTTVFHSVLWLLIANFLTWYFVSTVWPPFILCYTPIPLRMPCSIVLSFHIACFICQNITAIIPVIQTLSIPQLFFQ